MPIKKAPKKERASPIDEETAMRGALTFYSASCYQKFNTLTFEHCTEAVKAAQEASLRYPLHQRNEKGVFPKFEIPHFGERSSIYVIAIMSAWLVWNQKVIADNPLPGSPLLKAAKDGLAMFDRKSLSPYWAEMKKNVALSHQ